MERLKPDEILERIKAEERRGGKLKIFFGAMAGVGKTYSMLEAAKNMKREGIDVVIGYVETHKRAETEALLQGFEILPRNFITYKNVQLTEFDLDAALKRRPKLIIVDELAHSNVSGSIYSKRWQDIQELLEKDIDVYTTLNVQHCESVNDIIYQITGITVRETVPDTFIERADEIELVDLPTEELLKRLKEGKVYLGEQAERAAENFFKPGNLIALREIALRYTAQRVDFKLQAYKQTHSISRILKVRDSFLVCISPSPDALKLIRAGKRIASDLNANWIVAYVETPALLSEEDKSRISEMMHLSETLGAQIVTLSGQDIVDALISYAYKKNITKLIIGKPSRPRWKELIWGSVVNNLARKSGEIDIYLLSGDISEEPKKKRPVIIPALSWRDIVSPLAIVSLCTFVNYLLFSSLDLVNLIMIYLLGITWVGFRYGRRMSTLASFLSVLSFDFLFVPPYFSFALANMQHIITFTVMLIVGLTIAHLTGQLQIQTLSMRQREDITQSLYALSHELLKSSYPEELFNIALKHIQRFFACNAIIFTPDADMKLTPSFGDIEEVNLTEKDIAVVQWVYEHKKLAGKGTDTLTGAKGIYLPFIGSEKTVGIIGIFSNGDKKLGDPDQMHMLEMFVRQTAMAVEGAQLAASALDAKTSVQNERFKNMLLTSFSYELRRPLSSISKIASELLQPENINNISNRNLLVKDIMAEIDILNNHVNELPDIINITNT